MLHLLSALKAHKAFKEQLELREQLDPKVLRALKVPKVHKAQLHRLLVHKVLLVLKVPKVLLGLKVHKAQLHRLLVHKALLVPRAHKVLKVQLELKAPKAQLVHKV